MIKKISGLYNLLKLIYRNRNKLRVKLIKVLNENTSIDAFEEKFGYLPDGLEYNNLDILHLSPESKIGKYNRLILSETVNPCSNKESIISLGKQSWTGQNVEINILKGTQIIIKDYSTIQDYCKLIGDIIIERYCVFAPMVYVSSGNHYAEKDNPDIIRNQDYLHLNDANLFKQHSQKVHIEEDCWLGIGSFIKQGVYIGRGAVIGANAIITKNVKPYSIVGGNNKFINQRFDFNPSNEISAKVKQHLPYFYRGFLQKNAEVENANINDVAIFESNSAIVILGKYSFTELVISGKSSNFNNTINCKINFNGTKTAEIDFTVDSMGNFSKSIPLEIFLDKSEDVSDYVDTLSGDYNVFKIVLLNSYKITNSQYFGILHLKQFFYD